MDGLQKWRSRFSNSTSIPKAVLSVLPLHEIMQCGGQSDHMRSVSCNLAFLCCIACMVIEAEERVEQRFQKPKCYLTVHIIVQRNNINGVMSEWSKEIDQKSILFAGGSSNLSYTFLLSSWHCTSFCHFCKFSYYIGLRPVMCLCLLLVSQPPCCISPCHYCYRTCTAIDWQRQLDSRSSIGEVEGDSGL